MRNLRSCALIALWSASGCASSSSLDTSLLSDNAGRDRDAARRSSKPNAGALESDWARSTASTTTDPAAPTNDAFDDARVKCGVRDPRLDRVAKLLVARRANGERDLSRASELLRRAGLPYVWPRVWIGTASTGSEINGPSQVAGLEPNDVAERVEKWRAAIPTAGQRRCGTSGLVRDDSSHEQAVLFLTVDALADLAPLPTRTHAGTWLKLDAAMLTPAAEAHVLLVGPDGKPRAVPASFDGKRIRATFAPDRAGRFELQVLADIGQGPRPVLEALLFADVDPFEDEASAPGEAAGRDENDDQALARMVTALREELNLPSLKRDAELDALARAHTARMRALGKVGHDVGDGDPRARIQASNVSAHKAGENVARAESVRHAHRALYASPSHRENLIQPDFDRFGVAVERGPDGTYWVTELFAH